MVKSFKSKYTVVFHWPHGIVEVVGKFAYFSDAEAFAQYAAQAYHMTSVNILNKQADCISLFHGLAT